MKKNFFQAGLFLPRGIFAARLTPKSFAPREAPSASKIHRKKNCPDQPGQLPAFCREPALAVGSAKRPLSHCLARHRTLLNSGRRGAKRKEGPFLCHFGARKRSAWRKRFPFGANQREFLLQKESRLPGRCSQGPRGKIFLRNRSHNFPAWSISGTLRQGIPLKENRFPRQGNSLSQLLRFPANLR